MMPPTLRRTNQTLTRSELKHSQTHRTNQSPFHFNYQIKLEKALLDFDSNQEERLSHLRTQFGQHQDDMNGKINLLWKTVSKKLNDTSTLENAGNSMAHKSIAAISHDEKEELRKKGIKSPDTEEEDTSSTNAHENELDDMVRRGEGVKEQGKEEDEMETDMEVEEVIEEEESEFETDEEVKEVFEEDEDDESFNSFPTMKELIPVALSISTMEKWSPENPSKKKQALPTMKKKEWSCLARIESIPPSAHEENFGHRRTHYYQSFLIGDEYKQDRGDRRGIRHLMRLEKEMMDNKGEVT
ncbi:hypothetical protein Tco_0970065 [Tanacetum coccineum]